MAPAVVVPDRDVPVRLWTSRSPDAPQLWQSADEGREGVATCPSAGWNEALWGGLTPPPAAAAADIMKPVSNLRRLGMHTHKRRVHGHV